MVYVSRDTPYMKLLEPFLSKKHRLALDDWGADDTAIKHIFDPLVDLILSSIEEGWRGHRIGEIIQPILESMV